MASVLASYLFDHEPLCKHSKHVTSSTPGLTDGKVRSNVVLSGWTITVGVFLPALRDPWDHVM